MTIILHSLTAVDGKPAYTAKDYRKAANSFLISSNGTPFEGLSGVRSGAPSPLCEIDGTTVTVHAHSGTVSPWVGVGAYTYYLDDEETISVTNTTGNFKIALVVSDPSEAHGTVGEAKLKMFDAATPDSDIPGLVLASVSAGVVSDVAPIIQPSALLIARSKTQLDGITATSGQRARLSDGSEYKYDGAAWVSVSQMPEIYSGTTVLTTVGAGDWATLLNATQFQTATGHSLSETDIDKRMSVIVTNGDRGANDNTATGASIVPGSFIRVDFAAKTLDKPTRVNWCIIIAQQ